MTKEDFQKMWKCWLIDLGKSETQVSKEATETTQPTLNSKIKGGSMRVVELSRILNYYGYELKIVKKENN